MQRFFIRAQGAAAVENNTRIAFYIPTLSGGGAERMTLRLAAAFADRGYAVDLVFNKIKGPYVKDIPATSRVIELSRSNTFTARAALAQAYPQDFVHLARTILFARKPVNSIAKLPALADYLAHERPSTLISGLWYANVSAIWATALTRNHTCTVVTERNDFLHSIEKDRTRYWRQRRRDRFIELVSRLYARADTIVAISNGVGDRLARETGLGRAAIRTIYNPVTTPELNEKAAAPTAHPWLFEDSIPVLLAVGRLNPQKNFDSLITAFAQIRTNRRARLIILGEGSERAELENRINEMGLGEDIIMPGWVDNPYAYMRLANLFVLSSRYEGLGNVLIEALACGCPVVATDCPSGPREILSDGTHGRLVPVGDADALAAAIKAGLDDPGDAAKRMRRAEDFSVTQAVDHYQALVDSLLDCSPVQ